MRRYVSMFKRPKMMDAYSAYEPDAEDYLSRTVYEPEPQCIDTGILDKSGNPIMVIDEMNPIGFIQHKA